MKNFQILLFVFLLTLGHKSFALERGGKILPNTTFNLPESYQPAQEISDAELEKLRQLNPTMYDMIIKLGYRYETYGDFSTGNEKQNYLSFTIRKIDQKDYYEVKDDQTAKSICSQMVTLMKNTYKSNKDLKIIKCYRTKFPSSAKWGLYVEADHHEYDGRQITITYIDNNLNEVAAGVSCELKHCNRMRLDLANYVRSLVIR